MARHYNALEQVKSTMLHELLDQYLIFSPTIDFLLNADPAEINYFSPMLAVKSCRQGKQHSKNNLPI